MLFTTGVVLMLIGGIVVLLIGIWLFAASNSGFEGLWAAAIGVALIAIAITSGTQDVGRNRDHAQALHDLKAQGFSVTWLSIKDQQATISLGNLNCSHSFDLMKRDGSFNLVIASSTGPANLYPQVLRSLKLYCDR